MLAAPATATAITTDLAWLAELAAQQPPSRRQEDWRFTDLAPLAAVPAGLAAPDPWDGLELPAGVSRLGDEAIARLLGTALAASSAADHWAVRLNAGARPALLALRVSGAAAPLELPLLAPAQPGLVAWRLLLLLEPGASLELLQHVQPAAGQAQLLSLVTEAVLAEGAQLQIGSLALGHDQASLLQHLVVRQAPASTLQASAVATGWALARQEPRIVQEQGQASTQLRALQQVNGRQIADTHSYVRFDGPEGELDQLHKALADGAGRSVFNGAVQVPRAAQRTNAAQLSRSLLLSDRARIDTKPELEIVADDVKCAHGATISQLQDEQLFYLRSRGIAAEEASQLLQRAFCEEVVRALPALARRHDPMAALLPEA